MARDTGGELLFGLLALQTGLIDQARLVAAFHAWTRDRGRSLADHLVAMGHLDPAQRAAVEGLAAVHAARNGGGPETSLASLRLSADDRAALAAAIADPALGATLPHVGAGEDDDRTAPFFSHDAAGDRRFRVLRPHARGGLGAVFVALDGELNREVALKRILDHHADNPASRQRFLIEAEITGSLEHPGVVPVYGMGVGGDGRPYYAMRFIQGESFREAIDAFHADASLDREPGRRSVALRGLLRKFIDVCNTIEYAHSRGVLHRDVKPSNVIVGKHGETLVVDWGLAKAVGRRDPAPADGTAVVSPSLGSSETLPGTALGTPSYMSPEQAAGELDRLGPASDVYSLGATLYYLLAGRPPFQGDVGDVLRAVREGAFPPPSRVNARVDRTLEAVCLKAMASRPGDRHTSARALASDIELWAADARIPGVREPFGRRLARWERRNRLLVRSAGAALLVVTLVSVAAALAVQSSRAREGLALEAEKQQRELADRRRADADSHRRAAEELACKLLFDHGVELADRQEYGQALLWLARAAGSVPEHRPDLDRAIRTVADACRRLVTTPIAMLEHGRSPIVRMAYRNDGRVVITGSDDGSVRLWDAATGAPIGPPIPHDGGVAAMGAASSAPVFVVATLAGVATVHDAGDGRAISSQRFPGVEIKALAVAPDGGRYAVATSDPTRNLATLSLWSADGRQVGRDLAIASQAVCLAFSADGARVLVGCIDGTAQLADAATGEAYGPTLRHGGRLTAAAFRPDGKAVLTAGVDGLAHMWGVEDGKELFPAVNHRGLISAVAFRPDGRQFLTAGQATVVRPWDATTGAGQASSDLALGHDNYILSAVYSPDGSVILTGSLDHTAKLWFVEEERRLGNKLPLPRGVMQVAYAPDGRTLLTLDDQNGVRLWKIGSLAAPAPIGLPGPVLSIALSRDGRTMLTGGEVGQARFRETATGKPVGPVLEQPSLVWAVALSADERRALTGGFSRSAQVWDVATGRPVGRPMRSDLDVVAVAFSPDGSLAATGSRDRTVRLFDAATGEPRGPILTLPSRPLAVGFSRDGARLATASEDGLVRFWDAETGRPLGPTLRHENGVRALAFSPDGRTLATGCFDGTARVWDVATGKPAGPPLLHEGWVTALAFSPDGRTLATGCLSRTLRFWDVATGLPLGPGLWHGRAVWSLAFRGDGQAVLTGSEDRLVRTWPIPTPAEGDPQSLAHLARALSVLRLDDDGSYHSLTPEEWEAERRASREEAPSGGPAGRVANPVP